MVVDEVCSLRQYDLDQVMRVERFTLLSAPCGGAPRLVVRQLYDDGTVLSMQKRKPRTCVTSSADAALPFVLHLQFAGADARGQGEEVGEQAVEFGGLFEHGEVSQAVQHNLVGKGGGG